MSLFKPVLDLGHVRLVDSMGTDLTIVRAARVSFNAEWRVGTDEGSDDRLINYLWRNRHTSPFEHVQLTFEVKAPIFVFRQWHRHRTWAFNEVSARYAELPEEFYTPKADLIGTQSKSNKQARDVGAEMPANRLAEVVRYSNACHRAFDTYRDLLAAGWPRELARSVLPVSTYSRMYATVSLLNLFRFIQLRSHAHAQYEIRVYSDAMLELAQTVAPVAVAAFQKSRNSLD